MQRPARRWMSRRRWDDLISGRQCPICDDLDKPETEHGFLITHLGVSRLNLARNQYARGYCILIYDEHATELHELPPERIAAFTRDIARAGAAIWQVFKPVKMNYQVLGNAVPHLHCHIVPRYFGDPAPSRPLEPWADLRLLQPNEYDRLLAELRTALAAGRPSRPR